METQKFRTLPRLALILAAASLGIPQAVAQNGNGNGNDNDNGNANAKGGKVTRDQVYKEKFHKIPPSEMKRAAQLAAKRGLKPGIAGLTARVRSPSAGQPWPGRQSPTQAECRTISGPTVTGRSARSRRVPSRRSPSWTEALGTRNPTVTIDDAYLPTAAFTAADCHGDG